MNRFFAILIICSLSLPVLAINEQRAEFEPINVENISTSPEGVNQGVNPTNSFDVQKADDLYIPQELPSRYKTPVSKKKLVKKFIVAMLCVAGTALFLYITLSMYNKVRSLFQPQAPIPPEGEKPLDTPADIVDAVKTYINKTDWDK